MTYSARIIIGLVVLICGTPFPWKRQHVGRPYSLKNTDRNPTTPPAIMARARENFEIAS